MVRAPGQVPQEEQLGDMGLFTQKERHLLGTPGQPQCLERSYWGDATRLLKPLLRARRTRGIN